MNTFQDALALAGRIFLASLFLLSGFDKLVGFGGTVGYIASSGLPMPSVVAVLTILLELGGGLLLVVGLLTRPVALAIAAFTLLAAFIFHAYWSVPEAARMGDYLSFWKNISIAGGMLVLAAFGPGALSLDARRSR
ncbi:MAG: DoxX family protein [Caldimonas sp.]